MLYSFFITQWNNPCKGDWSEYVKQDLKDFQIHQSFQEIQSKSKYTFKKLVKSKAEEFALTSLIDLKNTHSKMDNLNYFTLDMKSYFVSEEDNGLKKIIFKLRTRMERFGENFRGGNGPSICPLCQTHLDYQQMSFQCPVILKETKVEGKFEDIYKENINKNTLKTIERIMKIRQTKLGYK